MTRSDLATIALAALLVAAFTVWRISVTLPPTISQP